MKVTLELPLEFVELCNKDGVECEQVLKGFIGDLCGIISSADAPRTDGYWSNGSDEREMADAYYQRVGYPYWNQGKDA